MDYLFGLKTRNFVLLASDNSFARGIMRLKDDADKSFKLGSKNLMVCIGEDGDVDQFGGFIEKNVHLYKMRNGYELSPSETAAFSRKSVADGLRSRDAKIVHFIMGGLNEDGATYLAYVDYLGSIYEQQPYVMHGYGGMLNYSILDSLYNESMSEAEAIDLLKMCLTEVKKRLLVSLPEFLVYVVDENGTRRLENIKMEDLS